MDGKDKEPKEKRLTYQEYEAEYDQSVAKEIELFKYATKLILEQAPSQEHVINDLYREVETPFISNECTDAFSVSDLRTKLSHF